MPASDMAPSKLRGSLFPPYSLSPSTVGGDGVFLDADRNFGIPAPRDEFSISMELASDIAPSKLRGSGFPPYSFPPFTPGGAGVSLDVDRNCGTPAPRDEFSILMEPASDMAPSGLRGSLLFLYRLPVVGQCGGL